MKGLAMGAADVVPGVSGGTIAFISGIYDTLLDSIANVNKQFFTFVLQGNIYAAWKHINGTFLAVLLLGIATSLLGLSKVVLALLENYPIPLWSFFGGLIIASTILVIKHITKYSLTTIVSFIIGIATAYIITVASPFTMPQGLPFLFISGAIAICAMILPGISGSFILVLLGQYQYILNALHELRLPEITVFIAGCIVGLLSFAKLLRFLLTRYHNTMVALLAGFMLGSLNKVWPWKETITTYTDSHGEIQPLLEHNILPTSYAATGEHPYVLYAVIAFIVGIILVLGIEHIASKKANVTVIKA